MSYTTGVAKMGIYLLIGLMAFSAPLACSLSDSAMSQEDKECCRQMADQCGASQMEESHTCCSKAPALSAQTLQTTARYSIDFPDCGLQVAADSEPVPYLALAFLPVFERCESPPGAISVLRI